jgi:pentatricopeptide repeat protein
MPQELIQIRVRNPLVRILLILLLIAAGVWSYFSVRWYLGNTLAEYFNTGEHNIGVVRMAATLAPDDPLTHWRIAQVSHRILPLDQQAQVIAEYEKAVSLSPHDYRFWMSLGTAYEQAGDPAKAEQALKRAVALAPSYSYPHWYLGNLLLRNARYDEAFAELRLASEADPELRPQQFNLIWAIYSNDPEALKNAVGQSASARATFALYLLTQNRFDDGLRLWNDLGTEEKKANKDTANSIISSLTTAHRFHDALKVWNEITTEKYSAEVDRVFDGSFEEPVSYGPDTVFGWQVKNAPQMQIGIDPNKSNGGARSLRLVFQVRADLETINVSQLVPVTPTTEYDFECYVATDKLQTGSAPQVEILDPTNNTALASSQMAPGGTNNWNRISFSFKTGEKTEAVILKIVRVSCSTDETPICPIYGSVWYDDFSFKRRN